MRGAAVGAVRTGLTLDAGAGVVARTGLKPGAAVGVAVAQGPDSCRDVIRHVRAAAGAGEAAAVHHGPGRDVAHYAAAEGAAARPDLGPDGFRDAAAPSCPRLPVRR